VADRVPAGLTECREIFFHAQQYATGSRSRGAALLRDVGLAGFTHGGGLYERRPVLFMEILEMRLDAFGEKILLWLCGMTELCHVAGTGGYDCAILRESRGDREQQQQCQSQRPGHVDSERWRGDPCMTRPVHNGLGLCKFRSVHQPID
jgi:hypothetical protein